MRGMARALRTQAAVRGMHTRAANALGLAPEKAVNPFVIAEDCLQPGIPTAEFRHRREQLLNTLPENAALIVRAATTKYVTNDIPYEFRQNSNFMYLTGLEEPDAVAVFLKTSSSRSFSLFVRARDAHSEQWDGARIGLDGAKLRYEADDAYQLQDLDMQLNKMLGGLQQVYVMSSDQGNFSPEFVRAMQRFQDKVFIGDFFVEQLRVYKSENELNRMRFAGDIAAGGFVEMMKSTRPEMTELALAAEFEAHCKRNGALWTSFPCVVGRGPNAAVIHYLSKRDQLKDDDLVLVDAGCEVPGYYDSDITRTWPVSSASNLSAAQKDLYDFTLEIQKKCLDELRGQVSSGESYSLDQLHAFASRLMIQGLQSFGILGANASTRELHRYNPTHIGHYLGMDVHDTPHISRSVPLRPGMVVTVEPGIYLPKNDLNLPEEFRGIGIRIEDDVVITDKGIEITTSGVPKELADIEALRNA
ncbi:hypothetical protein Poli38472_005466 [Pythium oligandrum]|uniref:Aminopeptidase P N-terminal domain-containing protein n=1 Tax=Pythium oligandrum TaxID=41045 RepID=A0A8K1FLM7_PYTOL|nr:hypothetical protein Poli38472_005466 [Pythium oligandrum]|eukprot:TMW62848.1 hypothetical protein Poli38472_005466 [Pythium oligandrum]